MISIYFVFIFNFLINDHTIGTIFNTCSNNKNLLNRAFKILLLKWNSNKWNINVTSLKYERNRNRIRNIRSFFREMIREMTRTRNKNSWGNNASYFLSWHHGSCLNLDGRNVITWRSLDNVHQWTGKKRKLLHPSLEGKNAEIWLDSTLVAVRSFGKQESRK